MRVRGGEKVGFCGGFLFIRFSGRCGCEIEGLEVVEGVESFGEENEVLWRVRVAR